MTGRPFASCVSSTTANLSYSIAVAPEVEAGVGTSQESGVALDWNGDFRTYSTTVVSKGLSLGVGTGVSLGLRTVPTDKLGGYAQGRWMSGQAHGLRWYDPGHGSPV